MRQLKKYYMQRSIPPDLTVSAILELYASRPYLDAYREHTDRRVRHDPQNAVGGQWNSVGPLQFKYLVDKGLLPCHRLLDIGCGTLRGGRHFIRYLNAARYVGFDLSGECVRVAHELVVSEGLEEKRAVLFTSDGHLHFDELAGQSAFDFILAQSVFTHLPRSEIETCFMSLHKVMNENSRFFFTFDDPSHFSGQKKPISVFYHPFELFETLASTVGLIVERQTDYLHPRMQSMAVLSLS